MLLVEAWWADHSALSLDKLRMTGLLYCLLPLLQPLIIVHSININSA
jgi:hypothetical protein